jgi:DNA-binding NarL/FixJ family response regulator
LEKLRVLIVDDCAVVRDGLRSILQAASDAEVVGEAVDGCDALAQVEKLYPDIILVDAQMPGMDGVETTSRIKEKWPKVKVLFLTVHSSYIEAALTAGADCCLMKDSTWRELMEAVRKVGRQAQHSTRLPDLKGTKPCSGRP